MLNVSTLFEAAADRNGFSFERTRTLYGWPSVHLVSGHWQGYQWSHDLVLVGEPGNASTAILYITGGVPNHLDITEAEAISKRAGCSVALLFGIPNQPLFDDRWEDDLIAFTFERFLESGDRSWPLLFPMVRAASCALDCLQSEFALADFVVTGMSKRGWTTWLLGVTGDPRIIGIAPMVFDNLNFTAQMRHQLYSWGRYSEQISDYTSRDLPSKSDEGNGLELSNLVDPFSYLEQLECPVLIVNGSNDRYWTSDALSLYWNQIPGVKNCLTVPNAEHILGDKVDMIATVGEFARLRQNGRYLPQPEFQTSFDGKTVRFALAAEEDFNKKIWCAGSETRDFRDTVWEVASGDAIACEHQHTAVFPEFIFEVGGSPYSLCLPTRIFSKT